MPNASTTANSRTLMVLEETVFCLLCIAEAALVWMLFQGLFAMPADARASVPLWMIVALILFTALMPRLLDSLDTRLPLRQGLGMAMIVASGFAAVKVICFPDDDWLNSVWVRNGLQGLILRPSADRIPVWGVIGLLAYAWWRAHVRSEPTIDSALQLFKVGTAVALVGAVIISAIERDETAHTSTGPILIYFTAAIAAIGIERLAGSERLLGSDALGRNLAISVAPAVLAAIVAVAIAGIFTRDTIDTIVWALGPLLWALSILFSVVVLGAALIAMVLLSPFFWLLDGHQFNFKAIKIDSSSPLAGSNFQSTADQAKQIPDPVRYIVAACLLFLIFAGVTKFVLRGRTRSKRTVEEIERSTERPVFNLRAMLRSLLQAARLSKPVAEDPLADLRGDPRWAATIAIRERFAGYLEWSKQAGFPRSASLTAQEHASQLANSFSGGGARTDVEELTAVYDFARYSGEPAVSEQAETARRAADRLLRKSKPKKTV
jgi:hypothetical protein